MSRFDYVEYDQHARDAQAVFKKKFEQLEHEVEGALMPGRARALIMTHLEEAYMWVGKQIRDDQIARNGSASLQEQRNNS